jgi:hypothetical protein
MYWVSGSYASHTGSRSRLNPVVYNWACKSQNTIPILTHQVWGLKIQQKTSKSSAWKCTSGVALQFTQWYVLEGHRTYRCSCFTTSMILTIVYLGQFRDWDIPWFKQCFCPWLSMCVNVAFPNPMKSLGERTTCGCPMLGQDPRCITILGSAKSAAHAWRSFRANLG